jgi:hypothetical protein
VVWGVSVDSLWMQERYAVTFQTRAKRATGRLEVERDRLLLLGNGRDGSLELEIPFSDLVEVRVGRRPEERLNGYRTLVLERATDSVVRVAPFGMAMLPEIADLLVSLAGRGGGRELAVWVPLKPDCLGRARELLAKGPPLDPTSLGLSGHDVYLSESEAVFVFHGANVRAQVVRAVRHPAVWRAGVAWQRCFAAPPQVVDDLAFINLDADPAYRWVADGLRAQA